MASEANKEALNKLKESIEAEKDRLLDGSNGDSALFTAGSGASAVGGGIKVRRVLKGHFGKVYAIHWAGSSDPAKLVSASQDGKLIVWNSNTMNKTMAIPLRSSWVMTCAFEREGNKMVACGGLDNLCSIYSASEESTTKAQTELAHHDGYLSCCRFVDANQILTSSGDSTCILWDVETQQPKQFFNRHTSDVMSISLSPDSPDVFVSGSCDAACILWDIRLPGAQQVVNRFTGHESDINSVAFFPDGKTFGSGSDDSSCRLFDTRCFNQVCSLEADKILCGVTSICFSKSGRMLLSGYDDYNMCIWDTLGAQKEPRREAFHDNRVSCIGTEAGGLAVCTGSWDTQLKCWA